MNERNITTIPLSGNSFLTNRGTTEFVSDKGWENWTNCKAVFSVYFKITSELNCKIYLKTEPTKNLCTLACKINENTKQSEIGTGNIIVDFGEWSFPKQGYVKIEIMGISRNGKSFPLATDIIVEKISTTDLSGYVKKDDIDNYYWSRRGPSVHCAYDIKSESSVFSGQKNLGQKKFAWFYNEVTVPIGNDPIGTYAMAIGFSGGYFGIQVNSETERRILFSIWSPFETDNPEEIPENRKVKLLGKHKNMHTGEFGGEGSGGQSYMKYNWESGKTYKFLINIHPDKNEINKTVYTAYFFFSETEKWELLASFLRPETSSYVEHPHSFLENFDDNNGFKYRKAIFTNQWAITENHEWFAPDTITFTADATARAGNREDYSGGTFENGFYLENGGFFDNYTAISSKFKVDVSNRKKPDIFFYKNSDTCHDVFIN